MPLTASDRAFLSQEWRFIDSYDGAIAARHPGSRDAEYQSAFVTIDGAQVALDIIAVFLQGDKRMLVGTVDQIVQFSFKGRPPTVRVRSARYGFDLQNGRLMLLERGDVDHATSATTLYLTG